MLLGIHHLVIAVVDPDRAAVDLERNLGSGRPAAAATTPLVTFDRLVWLGDSYLELIGVVDRVGAEPIVVVGRRAYNFTMEGPVDHRFLLAMLATIEFAPSSAVD